MTEYRWLTLGTVALAGAVAAGILLLEHHRTEETASADVNDTGDGARVEPGREPGGDGPRTHIRADRRAERMERDAEREEVTALVKEACSRNRAAREEAIGSLMDMGNEAVPHLAQLLRQSRYPFEIKTIAALLMRIGTAEAFAAVRTALDMEPAENRREIIASGALEGAADGANPSVTDLINDDPELAFRVHAGRTLGQAARQGSVWDWVDQYYRSQTESERGIYVEALGGVTDPERISELEDVLMRNPDDELAGAAAQSLARIGTAESVAIVVNGLRQSSTDSRIEVIADALGNVGNHGLLEPYLNDDDDVVRRAIDDVLDASDDDEATAQADDGASEDSSTDDGETGKRDGGPGSVISPYD